MVVIVLCACAGGCRSTDTVDSSIATRAVRYSESGAEEFAEGDGDAAMKAFRKAIHRSWAADDPYLAGTNAYNLAAVLFYHDDHAAAIDWLVDARVELARAGASAGNTYLLEAKIAQKEGRFDDARHMISLAACAPPPCKVDDDGPGHGDPCYEPLLHRVPCLGKKLKEKKADQQCRDDYEAQVHLARARLAAEQFDVSLASQQLSNARELAEQVCSDDLRAEMHHAAAMIDLAQGQYVQTAEHLDREALFLRQAANYRKIPEVLRLSAAAYEQAGRFDLAADRLLRAARIWFARGELEKSWETLQQAMVCNETASCQITSIRWSLTAREIEAAAAREAETAGSTDPPTLDLNTPDEVMLP